VPPRDINFRSLFGSGFFWYTISSMVTREKIIIALHGAGMHAGVWGGLAEKLSCQAVSFPGHGGTAGPLLPSIAAMAAWVEKQIKDCPPLSVVLLGHSMGALVAMEAARHPAVGALVLTGAAAQMPVHPDLLKQAVAAPEAAAAMILKWGVSAAHPEIVEVLKGQMQPGTLANDLAACNAYQHGEAAAQTIRQPVLVLAGSDDKLTKSAAGKALAARLACAQFHLVSGSGHMLMVEDPIEMVKRISVFVAAINS
jgi:aromatic-L-amino-acid decarboxylase